MSYSGGKDSSFALYLLRQQTQWKVVRLLTTGTREYMRSSMHGIRHDLVADQAQCIGLPLDVVWMDAGGGGKDYEASIKLTLQGYLKRGIKHVAFGDLFLEDVRAYREELNNSVGIKSVFPVWGIPTPQLAHDFIAQGFKAIVVCVDTTQLDASFCGRAFDTQLLDDLPKGVDPCAENGEFHTFCYDGPIFQCPVSFLTGDRVLRDGRFEYLDLLPPRSPKGEPTATHG